ncbi:MAG: cytochrome c-type biogenesis protein CcmH [Actinobacteria bacterium]|nr:cytochrome c-type biogenesis protein CcmH [Actinomycetota bacterium]
MRAFAAVWVVLLVLAPQAFAAEHEDLANDISNQVMSPFCPGVTLHDCPSDTALELRREIEGWAADGMTRDEIMTMLEEQYGPEIRAVPAASGSGLFAWILPVAGLLGAAGAGVWLSKRFSSRRGPDDSPVGAPGTTEELRKLESELRGLRGEP